ncbi:hypothetical protein H4219_005160 [Mycoemilia scoparia]|uniref:Uncharacterized protein n=1 Tax=Mycoemilia scoparia TaxID=417184 RepID=A0A9W7ZP06_9FUNG|nr:hypothetical protein H4219_005160 [Mycoemilia scoparia]
MAWNVFAGLVAFSLAKKVVVYTIARTYGFPRLYRRILTVERKLIQNREARIKWEDRIKFGFRWPNIVMQKVFPKDKANELRKEGAKKVGFSDSEAQRRAQIASDEADQLLGEMKAKKAEKRSKKH